MKVIKIWVLKVIVYLCYHLRKTDLYLIIDIDLTDDISPSDVPSKLLTTTYKLSHKFSLQDNKINLPSHFKGVLTSFNLFSQDIYFRLSSTKEKHLFDHFYNDFKSTMNKLSYKPDSKMINPIKGISPI